MIGFNNGQFQPTEDISVPVSSLSVNRGYGAFEFFEVIRGKPFYGDRHLARFRHSMELMRLEILFNDQLETLVQEIIQRNQLQYGYIKLFALPHAQCYDQIHAAALYILPSGIPTFNAKLFTEGAKLFLRNYQRFLPEAKSTSYLAGQYWMDGQSDHRVADVLFHNGSSVQECSRGNLFIVRDGTVVTPGENVLMGVTRGLVLELLVKQGILHTEAEVSLSLLHNADEVFISSTSKLIMPIVVIDEFPVGTGKPGPVTLRLRHALQMLRANY